MTPTCLPKWLHIFYFAFHFLVYFCFGKGSYCFLSGGLSVVFVPHHNRSVLRKTKASSMEREAVLSTWWPERSGRSEAGGFWPATLGCETLHFRATRRSSRGVQHAGVSSARRRSSMGAHEAAQGTTWGIAPASSASRRGSASARTRMPRLIGY